MLIDAHNHLQDARFSGKTDQLVAEMKQAGISSCVVNGTTPSDWQAVAELADRHAGFVLPSFGLHPWKVKGRASHWCEDLERRLEQFPGAGVGEIGLDRWVKDHDIEDQKIVFREQLQLAARLDRPCTVHCLKAWGVLLKELRRSDRLPRMLIHSFGGSIETASELMAFDVWFSFSGYFLNSRKIDRIALFCELPKDRILVETDAPDMIPPKEDRPFGNGKANHPANLVRISERLVELSGITQERLRDNTMRWWGRL